jgi:hypothetical protein
MNGTAEQGSCPYAVPIIKKEALIVDQQQQGAALVLDLVVSTCADAKL